MEALWARVPLPFSDVDVELGESVSRLPNANEAVGTADRRDDDPSGLKFIIEHERRDAEREERGRDAAEEPVIDPEMEADIMSGFSLLLALVAPPLLQLVVDDCGRRPACDAGEAFHAGRVSRISHGA